MTIAATQLRWASGGRMILDGVSMDVAPGTVLGLIGPNGSGKSSLLRLLGGLRRVAAGVVTLGGTDIALLPPRAVARRVAFVEQHSSTDADITVIDAVRLGRTPHRGTFAPWTPTDESAVKRALAQVAMTDKRHRLWHTLSGGERQRVQIARALAQSPSELLLDEPTNHLDIAHQLEVLALVRGLGVTTVVALHDLNLAAMFCDRILVLQQGRIAAAGTPDEVLTPPRIRAVFGVEAGVERCSRTGVLRVHYVPGPWRT